MREEGEKECRSRWRTGSFWYRCAHFKDSLTKSLFGVVLSLNSLLMHKLWFRSAQTSHSNWVVHKHTPALNFQLSHVCWQRNALAVQFGVWQIFFEYIYNSICWSFLFFLFALVCSLSKRNLHFLVQLLLHSLALQINAASYTYPFAFYGLQHLVYHLT